MKSKEKNSEDFCLDFVQEFGLWSQVVVTDLYYYNKINIFLKRCGLLPLGFLTRFSPRGFGKVFSHHAGQGGGGHGAAVRRRPCRTTRYTFSIDVLKQFLSGFLLVLERYAGNGAKL